MSEIKASEKKGFSSTDKKEIIDKLKVVLDQAKFKADVYETSQFYRDSIYDIIVQLEKTEDEN